MFKKILVANRAEIACRIIKTARRMGIATVAVYSEADREALHVQSADQALCIGPAPSQQSYLNVDAIFAACRESGADAVHPGYGFLSENAEFAEALIASGLGFIGPPPGAIRAMGDKIASKRLAEETGVNTIPGSGKAVAGAAEAVKVARGLGYPVMIKASAGGGGKGMRIAANDEECRDGFERAAGEAQSAFGDNRLLVEKYITEPRHVEIQVLADAHGTVVHLGERECSIQRRHQKVIEEAPSPLLDETTRAAMGKQAVALAAAVDYQSAGTVEFVMDAERNFYFLEMNTRLQVEHPVTEMVTGLDLVEQMIRVATGEPLGFDQEQVGINGWAMEARIYAEDPSRKFLPSIGRLRRYIPPPQSATVRLDSGVKEGAEVSVYYDPLLAKLIAHGGSREQAIAGLGAALDGFCIEGIVHNIAFLRAVTRHPRFIEGRLSTGLIDEEFDGAYDPHQATHPQAEHMIVAAAVMHRICLDRASRISGQAPGGGRKVGGQWVALSGDSRWNIRAGGARDGAFEVAVEDRVFTVAGDWRIAAPLFEAVINEEPVRMQVRRVGLHYHLLYQGCAAEVTILPARAAEYLDRMPPRAAPDTSRFLLSPMPGLLLRFSVEAGQEVKSGEEIAVVEAMKMENVLRAEHDAVIEKTLVAPGDTVTVDQPLLEFAG